MASDKGSTKTVVVPYKDSESGKKEQVARMFDNIAPTYDRLNRIISLGIDNYWRWRAIRLLRPIQPKRILDVATGTGDLALACMKLQPEKIIGVDISEGMLELGREKVAKKNLSQFIDLRTGDAENRPFDDNSFDALTVAFGVRNFEHLEKGLKELHRVIRPGGKAVILELTTPKRFPFKQFYEFHTKQLLPRIGKRLSKDDSAYTYLPESIKAFPEGERFTAMLRHSGFPEAKHIPLTFGVCSIYVGQK